EVSWKSDSVTRQIIDVVDDYSCDRQNGQRHQRSCHPAEQACDNDLWGGLPNHPKNRRDVLQRGHAFSPPRCGFLTLRTHSAQLLTCKGCWWDPLVELQALRSRTSVTIACTCLSLCFVSYLQAFVRLRFMFFFRLISNFCIAEYYSSL